MSMLDHLRVSSKLSLLSALFLIPIGFLTWLLVAQSGKDMEFAAKELEGVAYIDALRGLSAAVLAAYHGDGSAHPEAELALVRQARQSHGAGMGVDELAPQMDQAVGARGTAADGVRAAQAAIRAVISRVGDQSNLILDPDLDSYYTMDLVVVKLPDLLDQMSQILDAARTATSDRATIADRVDLAARNGSLQSLAAGIATDLETALANNPDGSLKGALASRNAVFRAKLDAYTDTLAKLVEAAVTGSGQQISIAALQDLHGEAHRAATAFWGDCGTQLDRLLRLRIDGFRGKLAWSLGMVGVVLVLAAALAVVISRSLQSALSAQCRRMSALAAGDVASGVPGRGRRDEIGTMAEALETFRGELADLDRLRREAEDAKLRADGERRSYILGLAEQFESQVRTVADQVTSRAADIADIAGRMGGRIDASASRSIMVAEAAQRASQRTRDVAETTSHLSAAIGDIRRQVSHSHDVADDAVAAASRTGDTVQTLSDSAQRIGAVVDLITRIAQQTNLLALNATIEAARAGDSGKGFAVVANEVKTLAHQTASATQDIAEHIGAIQSGTHDAVAAISDITDVIARVSAIATSITEAVDRQGHATEAIAGALHELAGNAELVANSVVEVTQSSAASYGSAIRVIWGAEDLADPASRLAHELSGFLERLRARH